MEKMKNVLPIILVIAVCFTFYELWQFGKWVNYKLAYESGVEKTIKEMVRPECLYKSPVKRTPEILPPELNQGGAFAD